MEYIEIISKEPIIQPVLWPVGIILSLVLLGLFAIIVCLYLPCTKDALDKIQKYTYIVGFGGIALLFFSTLICCTFFRVPTGQYQYEATINTDKISVAEYEEFLENYKPELNDGVYSWVGE
jgi:hypothetical protein